MLVTPTTRPWPGGTQALGGVTAAAGPFGAAMVQVQAGGQPFGQPVLAGRTSPGGALDDLVLTAGHWPDGPGQVVLDASPDLGQGGVLGQGGGAQLGSILSVTGAPGAPALTVVGFAKPITNTADGWVTPGEVARLRARGTPASTQMLYRFASAGTYAQIRADVAEVTRALPPGAVADAGSWLAAQDAETGNGAIMEPFVVAFALIGPVTAVLIVGNVVSGAVVAGYHRIGVLKSIGLTPAQVVVAYLSRVGGPALVGCLAGVVAGNLLAVSVQLLTMVVCWIAGPAVIAAVIAAPAAVALNTATLHAMAGTAHTGIPASFTEVFPPSRLALLSLAALAIAAAGALLPAGWAARARPATALRAE